MTPTTNRGTWRKTKGRWTLSLGFRGTRIRLFENSNGAFYRDVWIDGRKDRRSLQTRDKQEAERLGKLLLSELLSGKTEATPRILTLRSLWGRFSHENAAWLDNDALGRKDDERSAAVLLAFFGDGRNVATFGENDVVAFRLTRSKGGIELVDGEETKPVRVRTVQADLKFLRMMLKWATTVRCGGGTRLLTANPLDGIRFAAEQNAMRPVATWERFTKTRRALKELQAGAQAEPERIRWLKVELALVLAEATGRRLNSIRQLRWDDIDFSKNEIRWRAEADKKGKEWVIPISESLRKELRAFRKKLRAISGFVFPSDADAEQPESAQPMDRHNLSWWLRAAEKKAGLPKLQGGLWHPYRRKWATERKDLPIKDVMAAGGWSDAETLLKSYQQVDRGTLMRVMNEPRKLRETAQASEIAVVAK